MLGRSGERVAAMRHQARHYLPSAAGADCGRSPPTIAWLRWLGTIRSAVLRWYYRHQAHAKRLIRVAMPQALALRVADDLQLTIGVPAWR